MAHRARPCLLLSALAAPAILLAQGCGGSSSSAPPPSLSSVTPAAGTVSTLVTIAGANFTGTPTVTFTAAGGSPVQAVVAAASSTSIDAWVPAVPAGQAAPGTVFQVEVRNPDGKSASASGAFTMAAPVLTDVNGGLSGSGTVNSLFVLGGSSFGDLPAAPASGFSVDFRDTASHAVVATAAVAFAGGDWQNIFVVGTVPGALAGSTTYDVTVTTPSGTTAPRKFLVVAAVSFSPSTISWSSTAALPAALQGFPVVVAPIGAGPTTTHVYALGGNTASAATAGGKASNVATVSHNTLSDSPGGSLAAASWSATAALPAARGFAAAVAANGFNSLVAGNGNLYLLGGLDASGAATSTVHYASLAADGTIPAAGAGSWATTTPLPQPLSGHGAVLFHGRIYVAGGNDAAGNPVAKVWSARINTDGTLAAWQALPDLPVALAHHQLLSAAGNLYVLGGTTAAVDPLANAQSGASQSAVYYAPVNIRNGALKNAAWTGSGGMGKNREKFSAVVAGSYVLVSGGLYSGVGPSGSSEQVYAAIAPDGSLGSFNGATGAHTISGQVAGGYAFLNHAATLYVDAGGVPHVLIIGGEDVVSGTPQASVWYQH